MKKFIYISYAACAIFAACQKNVVVSPDKFESSFYAQIEQDTPTKTLLNEQNNVLWSEGDQVVIFVKNTAGSRYQIATESAGKQSARFDKIKGGASQDSGVPLDHNIAYYPYSDYVKCAGSGDGYNLNVVLPTEQVYVPGSFADGVFPMVAVSKNTNITFKNICGGLKFYLRGTQNITSLTLRGNNGEKLSGNAVVTVYGSGQSPLITMDSNASEQVVLDCGDGVQLDESVPTEFIIVLPPMNFVNGFTVTATDDAGLEHIIDTERQNEVKRSRLLVMPPVKVGSTNDDEEEEGDVVVPITEISLNTIFDYFKLLKGSTIKLEATIKPIDATNKNVIWSSTNPNIASVDQDGKVIAHSVGSVNIFAQVGDMSNYCSVRVIDEAVPTIDYIDEYGVNHGKGIAIADVVWAPVNCGYHKDDYKYGKLYQWGRKYGQGYSGALYVNGIKTGIYSDATIPEIQQGGVSLEVGQSESNANVFYTASSNYNWVYPSHDNLWNAGSSLNPIKTEYDPCPRGWRVSTYDELFWLHQNHSHWVTNDDGIEGYWMSDIIDYSSNAPQVFLPAAGWRKRDSGEADIRGQYGKYFASKDRCGYYELLFNNIYLEDLKMSTGGRAYACAVRCVQEVEVSI